MLKPVSRGVDDSVRQLLAPLLEGALAGSGWRVLSWDAEQGICVTFEDEQGCLLVEFEQRNDRLDCYARTERFNVCARRQFGGTEMSDADRAFVDAVIAVVRAREAALPNPVRSATERKTIVREVLVDRLLMQEGRNQYYINPYVGCMIACPFCYVIDRADFSRRLEGLPQLPWGHYLDVKINAAEVLRRETRAGQHGTVRMSPILTDPYQSAERRYRITRQCLEVLLTTDLVPVVLTRAPRILDDLELLKLFPRALVGFSIPTDADEFRQIFEPGADPIPDRLAALRALHAAGVATFAVIQPVLPMNVDRLVDEIAPYVRAVRLDRLYVVDRVRQTYEQHGLEAFATEEFADETIRRLTHAFRSRGVRVDSLDNLEPLLGP
jgi:DNA repair photolyase